MEGEEGYGEHNPTVLVNITGLLSTAHQIFEDIKIRIFNNLFDFSCELSKLRS